MFDSRLTVWGPPGSSSTLLSFFRLVCSQPHARAIGVCAYTQFSCYAAAHCMLCWTVGMFSVHGMHSVM